MNRDAASIPDYSLANRFLFATIYTCIAVAKYMKGQRYGKIVTVTSQAGVMPRSGAYAHYGVAKA